MCGHVGVAGNLLTKHTKAFKQLLLMDVLRGGHGTGIAAVPWHGDRSPKRIEISKMPLPSYVCLDHNTHFNKVASATTASVLIGHNRFATEGEHTYHNTHPFQHGNIVGAHNGTVSARNRLDIDVEGDFGTDSEEIIASINKVGAEETIASMYEGTSGAWALVWYSCEDNTLNFIRNDERPLFYGLTEKRDVLMWASEANMLKTAALRNGINIKVKSFTVNTHFSWEVPKASEVFAEKPARKKMKGKVREVKSYKADDFDDYYQSPYHGGYSHHASRAKPKEDVIRLPSSFDDKLSQYGNLDTGDIIDLFADNSECVFCREEVTFASLKNDDAVIISRDSVVCESCCKIPEMVALSKTA